MKKFNAIYCDFDGTITKEDSVKENINGDNITNDIMEHIVELTK